MSELSGLANGSLPRQQPVQDSDAWSASVFTRFQKEDTEQSIADRFQEQVARHSHRIAVKAGSQKLTYHELNKVANRIAQVILSQRGEGEEPIALFMEQGISLLAAILGVLKTGKIYVPLDPSLPDPRVTYILEDSQARLIITNSENLRLAHEMAQDAHQIINIDNIDSSVSCENPGLSISPDTLACIFYTSGTMGKPKGIVEKHRNILHEVMALTNQLLIRPDDRMCFFKSFSFAGSIRKVYPPLLNGASLCLLNVKKEGIANLANWLVQEGMTILGGRQIIRGLMEILTGEEEFPTIRKVIFGGDTIYRRDIELCRSSFSPDMISIGFAGTEFGTAARYLIGRDTKIAEGVVPVGYAVEDKKVLLLDEDGIEVGFNQIGEIAVKSQYLSPGYWRRPDLTLSKFLPDPTGGNERIYLTGDMGRMMPDGCLVHMGRKDFQVKIRGYRIEAAEVEAALLDLDGISRASVVAREEQPGQKRLVAYLVPNRRPAPNVTALRRSLAEKLPEYMIPSVFVMMDELPLTATGKVDRLALPKPDATRPELEVDFVAPRDELEIKLAKIWEEILGIDSIGVRDNFFDLGGHSLMAMQLFDQIQKIFGRKFPLIALLHAPTVGQLADILRQEEWSPPWSSLVEFQSGGPKPPFFCVHACDGEVFFYADLARHLGREQPFYGLRAQGLDGQQAPHDSIEDMAAHYIREVRTVQPEGPYFIGGGGVGGMIAFEMAQQLLALGQKVGLLILIDTAAPVPVSFNSGKSLGHYFRRSIHHLRHRQLTIILRNIVRNQRRRVTRRLKPRHIQLVRNALDMAPRSYIPEVYPGRVIYFLSGKREKAPGGIQVAIGDWYDLAADGLNVLHIPGDHLKILREPHVRVVAGHLAACLAEVQWDASQVGYVEAISTDGV